MDDFIGVIKLFPYTFVPVDWCSCEGQVLQITQYQALYSLLGPVFGGDGRTTFALPNLRGAEPVPGTRYCIAMTGIYPQRP